MTTRVQAIRREFNRWFVQTFADPDHRFAHLPGWLKADLWLTWQAARACGSVELRRVRHKNRGTTYEVIGEAEAQVTVDAWGRPFGLGRIRERKLVEGDKLTVYRCEESGKLYLRFPDEFEDGRFEDVPRPKG